MADHTDVIENEAPARERDVPRAEVAQRDVPAKQDKPPAEPPEAEKTKKRSPWGLIILGVLIVLAAIGGALYWYGNRNLQSTDDAYTDGRAITIIRPDAVGALIHECGPPCALRARCHSRKTISPWLILTTSDARSLL